MTFPPPAVPPGALRRPALERRLDAAFGARLTTVVASSGFGKSTSVASWAEDVRCVWQELRSQDATLDGLFRRLAELVDAATGSHLAELRSPGVERDDVERPEALAAVLARELEGALEHDLVIVLDDVHELETGSHAVRLLDSFCRQLPRVAHLVLLSRSEPPFSTARLRGRGELVELGSNDLAFDRQDVRLLATQALDEDEALADLIHERTQGWPFAVRLVMERLRDTPPENRLAALEVLPEELVSYLTDEVVGSEDEPTRTLIRLLAPFDRVPAELADELVGSGAARRLDALARRGLFVARHESGGGAFALHDLVRALGPARLGLDDASVAKLRRRAGCWHESRGELGEALQSYLLAGERTRLARLLAERGPDLLADADPAAVVRAAGCLDRDRRDERIELTVGDAHALRGEWELAQACYERIAAGARLFPPALAWRIGRIHFDQGRLDEALEAYSRAVVEGADTRDRALLLAWTASCHWTRGDAERARTLAHQALALASEADEPRARAVAHNVLMLLALGAESDDGGSHYRAALAAAEQARDARLAVRVRANRATQLSAQGAYADGLEVLAPALELAELAGSGPQAAFPLMKRGELYLRLGRLDDALGDFRAALTIYERFGSFRRYGALVNLGDVYLARGDAALARATLERPYAAAEESNDAQLLLFGAMSLARVLAFEDPERAAELAARALATARRLRFAVDSALLAAGWVALASGHAREAARLAAKARAEAERIAARPALAEALVLEALAERERGDPLDALEQAAAIFRETGDELSEATAHLLRARSRPSADLRGVAATAERALRAAGVRLSGAARIAGPLAFLPPRAPPALEIRTLGTFAVLRHGHSVPIAAWKSRQARELLKMLVARRSRPVPREQLMAALWPESDPRDVSGRFSFVLSTLRSVLDPGHTKDSPPYVETREDAVLLRRDLVAIDVESFLADAERALGARETGEDARALLEHAEAGYGGDFLEEDAYADWAVPLREQARAAYIAVAHALAAECAEAGDHRRAARYLLRVLERDAYDEEAHLRLVSSLEAMRAHGEARRAYRRYVAAMRELDIEPAPYPSSGAGGKRVLGGRRPRGAG